MCAFVLQTARWIVWVRKKIFFFKNKQNKGNYSYNSAKNKVYTLYTIRAESTKNSTSVLSWLLIFVLNGFYPKIFFFKNLRTLKSLFLLLIIFTWCHMVEKYRILFLITVNTWKCAGLSQKKVLNRLTISEPSSDLIPLIGRIIVSILENNFKFFFILMFILHSNFYGPEIEFFLHFKSKSLI